MAYKFVNFITGKPDYYESGSTGTYLPISGGTMTGDILMDQHLIYLAGTSVTGYSLMSGQLYAGVYYLSLGAFNADYSKGIILMSGDTTLSGYMKVNGAFSVIESGTYPTYHCNFLMPDLSVADVNYTFPAASGTIALTGDLSSYLKLDQSTPQTITGYPYFQDGLNLGGYQLTNGYYLSTVNQDVSYGGGPTFNAIYVSGSSCYMSGSFFFSSGGSNNVLYSNGSSYLTGNSNFGYDGNKLGVTASAGTCAIETFYGSNTARLSNNGTTSVYGNYAGDFGMIMIGTSIGTTGTFLRSNGSTGFVKSTLVLPDAATSGYAAYASGNNTLGFNNTVTMSSAGLLTVTGSATTDGLALTSKLVITGVTGGARAVGSAVTIASGQGGSSTGVGGVAGAGGTVSITGANGGAATSTPSTGGAGAPVNITAGNGGNGTTTNGIGGSVTITAGASTTTASSGNILFKSSSTELMRVTYNGDFTFRTSTGTKFGTATNQLISFWNKTPIAQPTTAITAAAFVGNTSAILNDTATFGGYTLGQIAAALINSGILA